jgi:DtxR family transcriptional regulator, Mn-dependent transcriptional regulator
MPAIAPRVEEALEHLYIRKTERPGQEVPESFEEPLRQAAEAGYVRREGEDWVLTDGGVDAGRDVVRRHRLAEHLLRTVLDVQPEAVNEDACEFEHILRHGLDDRICALLGHPSVCPHGHPIPEGECCRKAKRDQIPEVGPLCDGRAGQEGRVAYLSARDSRETQKIMALGVLPGAPITLLRRFPSYVFQVGYSQYTIDRKLAEQIHVHWGLPRPAPGGGP